MNARSLWLRLRSLASRRRAERELREELEFHIEMQARKHRGRGLAAVDAVRLARLEFGNLELAKEDARDVRGVRPIEDALHDVRYALRGLRRSPGFALSVILTIGLGVGMTTSAFTIFNAYVLRPFDIRDPYSLYSVQWQDRAGHVREFFPPELDALRQHESAFEAIAAYRTFSARLKGLTATGEGVSANYFEMLGVRASIGRTFGPDDRAVPLVVFGNDAWRTRFGADSGIVGRRVLIRGHPFQIIGVAQPGFEGLFKKPRDFWIPIDAMAQLDSLDPSLAARLPVSVIGRLARGVSERQGSAFVTSQLQSLTADLPDSSRVMRSLLSSRASAIPRTVTSYLAFAPILIAFGLMLVLASANVANMLLARGLTRQREFGVRLALGAGRSRLIRQLATESIVLALPAVAIGFAIAWLAVGIGVRTLFATLPADLSAFVRLVPLEPDIRVLAFAFVVTVGSAFLFGLVPSLQTTRVSVVEATRGIVANRLSSSGLRNLLVVGQIVVASLLLITAGVLLREASRLGRVETGLRTRDVLSVEVEDRSRATVIASLRANRLVDTIAAASALPLDMKFPVVSVAGGNDSVVVGAMYNEVSRSYFDVLGIELTSGRGFTPGEETEGAATVIISDVAARRLWPTGSPLGQTLRLRLDANANNPMSRYQNAKVIGTVRDVIVNSVGMGRDHPVLYFPAAVGTRGCCVLVRAKGDPNLAKRAIDADLERDAPGGVDRIDRLETFVVGAVYPYRVAYWIAIVLGSIALGLTAVGVYGVVAFVVGQRAREIGIRIALGATTRDILELVLEQSVRHALVGVTIGAVLALCVARLVAAIAEGMPAFDVVAFVGASTCVVVACLCAALIPSRRAASINPNDSLRLD
jgi:predicted permease